MDNEQISEQLSPSQTADILGVSSATLRKYSLLVERVTQNQNYYQRYKGTRIYTNRNVAEFQKLIALSKQSGMTLDTAANSIFVKKEEPIDESNATASPQEVVNDDNYQLILEKKNDEIISLKKKLKDVQQENFHLIQELKSYQNGSIAKEVEPTKDNSETRRKMEAESENAYDRLRGNNSGTSKSTASKSNTTRDTDTSANQATHSNTASSDDRYKEMLAKANKIRETRHDDPELDDSNIESGEVPDVVARQAEQNRTQTLESMQLSSNKSKKKHWWEKL